MSWAPRDRHAPCPIDPLGMKRMLYQRASQPDTYLTIWNQYKAALVYIVLGPPGCAQVSPYLGPGLLDFFGGMKTANKPHASRNYTQDQLSVHTAAEN